MAQRNHVQCQSVKNAYAVSFQKFFAALQIDSQRWDNPARSAGFSYSFARYWSADGK
jgi:hypothetical protein